MTTITKAARGASAFTDTEYVATGPLLDSGPTGFDGESPTGQWMGLIDELLAMRGFQDDWDGQGARAPDPSLVDGAIRLAQNLKASDYPPADRAIASTHGTIYFEWHRPGAYIEIEVVAADTFEVRTVATETNETTASRFPIIP